MELKVGMYVRGSYYQYKGKIGKIIKNYQNELEIAYKDRIMKTTVSSFIDDNFDNNGKQYKASYNIIDLIEVGDYVNGVLVIEVGKDYYRISNIELGKFFNEDIEDIVTREQFESMKYKIGE